MQNIKIQNYSITTYQSAAHPQLGMQQQQSDKDLMLISPHQYLVM
jgi:hypothetical protein